MESSHSHLLKCKCFYDYFSTPAHTSKAVNVLNKSLIHVVYSIPMCIVIQFNNEHNPKKRCFLSTLI